MLRSIRWPPKLSGGRLLMTPSPDDATLRDIDENIELRQVIALGVQDGESSNPFNVPDQLGIPDVTFSAQTGASRAQLRGRIRERFAVLERQRRARLIAVDFSRTGPNVDGDPVPRLIAAITYENLETGARQDLEQSIG